MIASNTGTRSATMWGQAGIYMQAVSDNAAINLTHHKQANSVLLPFYVSPFLVYKN